MTTLRTAAQQALEALEQSETTVRYEGFGLAHREAERKHQAAITALRAALAQEQEPAQEPAAVVGTQVDVWRGCDGRWAPPGEPIKTALMLKDIPVGTMLYTTPPKRQPLTEEEIKDCFHAARNAKLGASKDNSKHRLSVVEIARAIERAHGIIEPRIEEDSHQTLDDAMQQPRAMAQAYESGYKAGQAHEREACAEVVDGFDTCDPKHVAAAIRARGNT